MVYQHLRPEEREVISHMLSAGASKKSIAQAVGRHRTTISRELRRNGYRDFYVAVDAQQVADRRRQQARAKSRKLNRPENREYVIERLRMCWSPDQIAGRSSLDFPQNPERRFSRETIYKFVAQDDHSRRWRVLLRHHRPRRRRKNPTRTTDRALARRPAIVNQRGRYGDWEGDTIVGAGRHGGALVSLVERKSGYLVLLPVPNRHADKVRGSICGRLQQLPAELRQTLTLDNGSEFAQHEQLERMLEMVVFFTDPRSPWQRGSNENTNGLVRQFHPKGTNFNEVSRYKVGRTETLLNDRPRKRLNYQTPSEIFNQQCCRALQT